MENIIESAILEKMAVAKQIVDLQADPLTQSRIDKLAANCNEGELTDAEQREYRAYVEAVDLVGILRAKARAILASLPPS